MSFDLNFRFYCLNIVLAATRRAFEFLLYERILPTGVCRPLKWVLGNLLVSKLLRHESSILLLKIAHPVLHVLVIQRQILGQHILLQ